MSNNIKYNNIKIFENRNKKKIFKNNIDFKFKDFLKGKLNSGKIPLPSPLPLIPVSYFNSNKDDNIGAKIIDKYYSIKYKLRQLRIIKEYIFTILELSKDEINKKKVSFTKYKLQKNKLIIDFNEKLSDTFKTQNDFNHFKLKYCFEKYNYLKNIKLNIPLFFSIFQNEYIGSNKSFFLNLFRSYIEIRNKLLKYIDIDKLESLMAFDKPFFDLKNKINMEKKILAKKKNKENK
jgi:hypothetical protein